MDAGSLSKCIIELVGDRDEVEVPGLGVFYATMTPARFSEDRTVIYPPRRILGFRRAEASYEGGKEFFSAVARFLGLSRDDAETEVSWCISRLKSELSSSGICALPGLGEMKADSGNAYSFTPEADLDICLDGIVLEPVSLKINEPKPETAPAVPEKPVRRHRAGRIILWVILALVLLAIIFLAVYFFQDAILFLSEGAKVWFNNLVNFILSLLI